MTTTSFVRIALSIFTCSSLAACGSVAPDAPPAPGAPAAGVTTGAPDPSAGSAPPARATNGAPAVETEPLGPPLDVSTKELSAIGAKRFVECEFHGSRQATEDFGGEAGLAAELEEAWALRFRKRGVAITQAQIDACVAQLEAGGCGTSFAAWIPCDLRGTLEDGEGCRDDFQCASGYCTGDVSYYGEEGSCGACAPRPQIGQACGPDSACERGVSCHEGKCTVPVSEGASCVSAACGLGLSCVAGVCRRRLQVGEACVVRTTTGARTDDCDAGLRCIENACAAPLPLDVRKPGELCTNDVPGRLVVCDRGRCSKDTKRCVAEPPRPEIRPGVPLCK